MTSLVNRIMGDVEQVDGLSAEQVAAVKDSIQSNLPAKTYNTAVLFLGLITIVSAIGSILLPAIGASVPEALWSALGAGIGGLAGIFMSRD